MKNTMKKLLCMALAIMLLVSAVPVFAMADDGYTVTFINENKQTVYTWHQEGTPNWANPDFDSTANWALGKAAEECSALAGRVMQKHNITAADARNVTIYVDSTEAENPLVTVNFTGDVTATWTYRPSQYATESNNGGLPNWDAGAAKWAMEQAAAAGILSKTYDKVELISTGTGYNAEIKLSSNTQSQPEKKVVVTFKLPDGTTKTWSYAPSAYDNGNNNGGVPEWTEDAAAWAMREAVKANALDKVYAKAVLKSATDNGYAATIELSNNASSTETTGKITVTIKVGSTVKVNAQAVTANEATVNELIKKWNSTWTSNYSLKNYTVGDRTGTGTSGIIYAGESVTINLVDNRDDEFMDDIYLYIYVNNDLISPAKRILLNNYSIVSDDVVNKSEILSVVDDYYKATDSNKGIVWKGMYLETGNITALDFINKNVVEGDSVNLATMRKDGYTDIVKVRVTGVTTKYSSTADSSNPKTGDSIMVPVMVAGLTASALAVAYVFGKKRFAR